MYTAATPEAQVAPEATATDPVEATPTERIELTPENFRETEIKPADRDKVLFGEPEAIEPKTEAASPAEPITPAEPPEKLLPNRISTAQFDTRDQEAIALRHELKQNGEEITLREACERIEAKYAGPKAAETPAVATPEPVADPNDPIALAKAAIETSRAEVAKIRDSLKEYRSEPAVFADEITEAEARLDAAQDAITDSATKLAKLELKAELAAERESERQTTKRLSARDEAKGAVLAEFPTASDDESLLGAEVSRIYAEMLADPKHPDHARLAQDDGPKWLVAQKAVPAAVARLVKNLGYSEEQALNAIKGKPIAEAKGPIVAPARTAVPKTVTTATGNRPAPEPAGALDDKTILEKARTDPKIRDAALGFGGGWVVR